MIGTETIDPGLEEKELTELLSELYAKVRWPQFLNRIFLSRPLCGRWDLVRACFMKVCVKCVWALCFGIFGATLNSLIHCRNRIWNQFTGHSIWQAAETAGILCEIQYQQVCNWTKNCCRCTRASLILSHLDPFCCLVSSVISSRFTATGLLAARRSALCLSSSPLLSFLTSGRLTREGICRILVG